MEVCDVSVCFVIVLDLAATQLGLAEKVAVEGIFWMKAGYAM